MYEHIDFTTPSLETTVRQVEQFAALADRIPAGSPINMAFVEDIPVTDRLAAIHALSAAGLRVRPILSARRILSEAQLAELVDGITGELGMHEVMLVGGDPTTPAGPYATALELLESPSITNADLRLIGLPGFPKEHPTTSGTVLLEHMAEKVAAVVAMGRDVEITTQLCLDPEAVCEWIARVRSSGITAPIRIGIPAPTTTARLLRFCQLCKVDASLDDLSRFGWVHDTSSAVADPASFLHTLSKRLDPTLGTITTHIYPMGDVPAALTWLSTLA